VFGEKAFPALKKSRCEALLTEGNKSEVRGRVYKKEEKDKEVVLFLDQIETDEETPEDEKVIVYLDEDEMVPEIGRYVTVWGKVRFFNPAPNPGNFNQKFYYQKQRIYAALDHAEIRQTVGKEDFLCENLWKMKMYMKVVILDYLGEDSGSVLCSMLLGEAAVSDGEEKELYQKSGIGHIMAISGLHVSFLGMGLYRLLRKLGCPVGAAALVGSAVMCLYAVMVGASVSAIRAVVMFLMRMGAYVTGREYDGLTALAAAAAGTLVLNPIRLFDAGFQLSYGAIFGIYVLGAVLEPGDDKVMEKGKHVEGVDAHGNKRITGRTRKKFLLTLPRFIYSKMEGWWTGVKKSFAVSLAIQVVLLPVMLYYYYEICVYSLLWNLVVIPLASVILGCGIAGILLGSAAGYLGIGADVFFYIVDKGLEFYCKGSKWVLSLPGARWVTGQPRPWQIAGYTGCMLVAICFILGMRRREMRGAGVLFMLCGVLMFAIPQGRRGEIEIVMIQVEQGDSFFIRGPKGDTHLIDGGSSTVEQVGRYRIEPFLKSQGAGSIDYVWISHGDIDHIGGIAEMISRKQVGVDIRNLVLPPKEFWDDSLSDLAELAQENKVRVLTIQQGKTFSEGNLTLSCLWPCCKEEDTISSSESSRSDSSVSEAAGHLSEKAGAEKEETNVSGNEASMVLSLTYGDFDMLFTGDLEKEGEAAFVELLREKQEDGELPYSYDVLKVGHHGSRFATSEKLLEAVSPSAAWISAGTGNLYGHPHPDVLERLANWNVSLYNTKDGSAVKLCTDGKKYCILRP